MKKGKERNVRKSPSRVWAFTVLLGTVVVLAIVAGTIASSRTASAKQSNSKLQSAASDDNDTTVQFANQKITIDAQTGRLRKPTVEEARALVDSITGLTNRSTKGLHVEQAANGMNKIDLQGRFQTVVLAKPNADGTNEIRCVSSLKEAAEFLGIDPAKLPAKNKSSNNQ
jgi:septal ring-binding cell division protein DamX